MEQVQHQEGPAVSASSHVCPKCKQVGRVYRSWPRGIVETIALKLLAQYGLYRCHDCNWRGWKMRSTASPLMARIVLVLYLILLVIVVVAIVFFLRQLFPKPRHMP